jgi:hypothetical protein
MNRLEFIAVFQLFVKESGKDTHLIVCEEKVSQELRDTFLHGLKSSPPLTARPLLTYH